jgi:MSHA biogenesis protein MshP
MRYARTRGFALLSAIFLMVVLAVLGFYLLSLAGAQQFTGLWALQGSRAYYAARTGLQWGAHQAVNGGACNGSLSVNAGAPQPFTVQVSCTATAATELGQTLTVYRIEAVASSGDPSGPGYVSRRAVLTVQ